MADKNNGSKQSLVTVLETNQQKHTGVYVGTIDMEALEKLYSENGNAFKYALETDDTLERKLELVP